MDAEFRFRLVIIVLGTLPVALTLVAVFVH